MKLYNEDCLPAMLKMQDNQFDLAIVDPPYGLPKSSTHGRGKLKNRIINNDPIHRWDYPPEKEYFKELFRVSKNQIICGGNYFDLPPTRGFVVWDKKQPFPNFSRCEYLWMSFQVVSKIFELDNRTKGTTPNSKTYIINGILDKYLHQRRRNGLRLHNGLRNYRSSM